MRGSLLLALLLGRLATSRGTLDVARIDEHIASILILAHATVRNLGPNAVHTRLTGRFLALLRHEITSSC